METRLVEIGLITCLSITLGYTIASQQAVGYPAGAAVSSGSNPVFSEGGSFSINYGSTASAEVFSAPEDQDLIITDLVLDAGTDDFNCIEHWRVDLTIPDSTLASTSVSPRFRRQSGYNYSDDSNYTQGSQLNLNSGLRVPAGTSAQLEAISMQQGGCTSRNGQILWTASGYYAQP